MWPRDSICLRPSILDVPAIAKAVHDRTCRTGLNAPGFCVVNVGDCMDAVAFRQLMVDLKREMAEVQASDTGSALVYLSAMRFDQQQTTRPHLDGGPDECLLMLGYEPSAVDSELEIADYAKCAFDLGLSPKAFMAKHNPMFRAGHELLRPYSTRIPCFARTEYRIVCINNSSAPLDRDRPRWQGTLHTARILTPDESKRRVLNSTLIARAPAGTPDKVSESEQLGFINTSGLI